MNPLRHVSLGDVPSRPVLFVEGRDDSIDVFVLTLILRAPVVVRPLGPSYRLRSVAEALSPVHPNYYFLIDRDHLEDSAVDDLWCGFPDPARANLLVWRKKEIENYFLAPEFLEQSSYLVKPELLRGRISRGMEKRLCMGVANRVIVSVREDLKANWVELYSKPEDFPSRNEALAKLRDTVAFASFEAKVNGCLDRDELARRFNHYFDMMTGGGDKLMHGVGRWLDLLSGKAVLNEVLASNCFVVKDQSDKFLQGDKKAKVIVKELLSDGKTLPKDFVELKELIQTKVLSKPHA